MNKIQLEKEEMGKNVNSLLNDIPLIDGKNVIITWKNNIHSCHKIILEKRKIIFDDGHCKIETFHFYPFIEIIHEATKLKISALGLTALR